MKLMRKIFIFIYDFYNLLIQRCNKNLFVFFYNLRASFGITKGKISYKKNLFYLNNDYKKVYFTQKKLGIMFYSQGLKKRQEKIKGRYFLNEIVFDDNDIVVDCGANYGDMFLYFEILEKKVDYHAFEPSPEEFSILNSNTYGKIKTYNLALGDKNGELDFYIKSKNADSSLIKPMDYDEIITVNVMQLTDLFQDVKNIKLLKVEAEGAEIEVIKGSIGILNNIEYITGDFGFERGIDQSETYTEVKNILEKNNFELLKVSDQLTALFKNKNFN